MKKIMLAAAVLAGLGSVSLPANAQLFFGPALDARFAITPRVAPTRDTVFSIFNPGGTGVDSFVPPQARPNVERANNIIFATFGISRVSRFFGIF